MDQSERKQIINKETHRTAIMFQSVKKETEDMREQKTKQEVKKTTVR